MIFILVAAALIIYSFGYSNGSKESSNEPISLPSGFFNAIYLDISLYDYDPIKKVLRRKPAQ